MREHGRADSLLTHDAIHVVVSILARRGMLRPHNKPVTVAKRLVRPLHDHVAAWSVIGRRGSAARAANLHATAPRTASASVDHQRRFLARTAGVWARHKSSSSTRARAGWPHSPSGE